MKRLLLTLLLIISPLAAIADYPMTVTSCLDNMSVSFNYGVINNQAFVRVENFEGGPIFCEARFKASSDRRTRKTRIKPDHYGLMVYAPPRTVTRMYVTVYCTDRKDDMKDKASLDYSCQKSVKD